MRMLTALADAEVALAGAEPVDVGAQQVGLVGDAAGVLEQLDLGEDPQVPDELEQHDDREHRGDERQDDVPQPLDAARAVEGGRLHHLGADLGQPRVDAQGDERHAHPDDDDAGDDEEGQRLGQPVVALRCRRPRAG